MKEKKVSVIMREEDLKSSTSSKYSGSNGFSSASSQAFFNLPAKFSNNPAPFSTYGYGCWNENGKRGRGEERGEERGERG